MKKIVILFIILVATQYTLRAQETRIIKFKQQPLSTRLQHFHVAEVKDVRKDTVSIGSVRSGLFSKRSANLNFPGGPAHAIDEFFTTNLQQDPHTPAVSLRIAQLEVGENTGGLRAESEVRMTLFFYIGGYKIMEYKGANTVSAGLDASRYIEEQIRKFLDNILQQFDTWCGSNKEELTAASAARPFVTVKVEVKEDSDDSDMIAWSFHRPLTLADFIGKPSDISRAGAVTSTGIHVKYNMETQFAETKVLVTMTAFFDKAHSWCRPTSYNPRTLMHEQKHFDITALKTCELAIAIRSHTFTPENYMKELEQLYKAKDKELREEQDLYDNETSHGQLPVIQEKWQRQIHDSLQTQTCFHP